MILHYQPGNEKSRQFLDKKISELKNGHEYVIEIKQNRPVRSISHNRYYFAVIKAISIHTGEGKDRLHELFKCMFNYSERIFKNGLTTRQPESTTKLDSKEFELYIEKIKKFAKDEWDFKFIDYNSFDIYTEQSINEEYSNVFDRV